MWSSQYSWKWIERVLYPFLGKKDKASRSPIALLSPVRVTGHLSGWARTQFSWSGAFYSAPCLLSRAQVLLEMEQLDFEKVWLFSDTFLSRFLRQVNQWWRKEWLHPSYILTDFLWRKRESSFFSKLNCTLSLPSFCSLMPYKEKNHVASFCPASCMEPSLTYSDVFCWGYNG